MKKFLNEFKTFALKGNVVDLAVGVIIGAAFQGIVTAFTDSFITPLINSIGGAEVGGSFEIFMAFVIFLIVKGINTLMSIGRKKEEAAPPVPSKEEVLLTEIRDLLKAQTSDKQ